MAMAVYLPASVFMAFGFLRALLKSVFRPERMANAAGDVSMPLTTASGLIVIKTLELFGLHHYAFFHIVNMFAMILFAAALARVTRPRLGCEWIRRPARC